MSITTVDAQLRLGQMRSKKQGQQVGVTSLFATLLGSLARMAVLTANRPVLLSSKEGEWAKRLAYPKIADRTIVSTRFAIYAWMTADAELGQIFALFARLAGLRPALLVLGPKSDGPKRTIFDVWCSHPSWDAMVQAMTKHVMEKHPDTAKAMEKMHNEDPKKWGRETKPKWEATPET